MLLELASEAFLIGLAQIIGVNIVLSGDNAVVIALAAAAKGGNLLLAPGLAISIPLVIFGATMLLHLMERFPVVITTGAALLGGVAGEMATTDPVVRDWIDANAAWLHTAAAVIGAA